MFLALWEFEVKSGCEERFRSVYGAEGEWARLFQMDENFIETRLVRDAVRANKFVTLDFWESRSAYESFKELNHAAYLKLDREGQTLTTVERCLGYFDG
jgi:heme-degrading monooxygenase HmoA